MRPLATALVLSTLALAACGGDDSGESASGLDAALGYLPEDAPLVIAIDTDLDGSQYRAAKSIAGRFPIGGLLEEELEKRFEGGGVTFNKDIRPLLGNEFVVGATDVRAIIDDSENDEFVAAIETSDADRLREVVAKGAKEKGEQNGATLFEDSDGDAVAVEEGVLVVAGSEKLLTTALEQRDADDRLTEQAFREGLGDLPEEALVKVYSQLGALIEGDPETASARRVKWVAALETLGLTASVTENEVAVDFEVHTDGDDALTDKDLPLASGAEAPEVARAEDQVGFALRDPAQVFNFIRSTVQAIEPQQAGQIDLVLKQVEERTGVSLEDDVLAQLSGGVSASVGIDGELAGIRGVADDPRALERAIGKLAPRLPELFGAESGGVRTINVDGPNGSGTLYDVRDSDGDSFTFGVLDDAFVAAETPQKAQAVASLESAPVEGAEGAFVIGADAKAIADAVLAQMGGLTGLGGSLFTEPLGPVTGSVESSTDGLNGSFTLQIED